MVDIKNDDMKILNSKVVHTSNTVHNIDKSKATITYDVIGERISRKLHVSTRHVACRRNTELILQNLDLSSAWLVQPLALKFDAEKINKKHWELSWNLAVVATQPQF